MLLKKYLHTLLGVKHMSKQGIEHIAAAMQVGDYPDGHVFVYQDRLAKVLLLPRWQGHRVPLWQDGQVRLPQDLRPCEFFGLFSCRRCAVRGQLRCGRAGPCGALAV